MSRIRCDKLTVRFGPTTALDDVSLQIAQGALVALLGPSGSGKTTLLRAIAGFVRPAAGAIRFDGETVTDLPAHRRGIGMVFQSYALFPHLSVADNVAFGLAVRGRGRDEQRRRVAAMLDLVELGGMARRRPAELSGGQQQRVALARALAPQPRVLLLDEPLSALDRRLRQAMQLELRAMIRHLGITTLMVTHDQEEALTMADRIAVLADGRVVQEGTPAEVYERPRTAFAATFLGEANLLEGGRVALRPERLHLLDPASGPRAGWSAIDGAVTDVIYGGPSLTVLVQAEQGPLRAIVPNTGAVSVSAGERVRLGFRAEDAVRLEA